MHLGNEVFDVTKQPLQGDFNHLFIRQGTGLQGQAVFRTKMSFRPHSTDSFTHQKMTRSMADRSTKKSGIKIIYSCELFYYMITIGVRIKYWMSVYILHLHSIKAAEVCAFAY